MQLDIIAIIIACAVLLRGLRWGCPLRGAVTAAPLVLLAATAALSQADLAAPTDVAAQPASTARPIDWARAEPFVTSPIRRLTGTVRAMDRAPLGFEVSGRVERVMVEIGDRFEAGDVLATLETTSLQIALDQAEASLMEAQAVVVEAELDFNRQQTLLERGVVSGAARDSARATLDSAYIPLDLTSHMLAVALENFWLGTSEFHYFPS